MNAQQTHDSIDDVDLLPITTFVIWMSCITVGTIGLSIPYPRPRGPTIKPPPLVAEVMHVTLTPDSSPPDVGPPTAPPDDSPPLPPAAPETIAAPPSPPLIAVAAPSSSIAFALPTEGPTQIVPSAQVIPARPTTAAASLAISRSFPSATNTPQHLIFGQGEARQPAPEYPREAAMAHQEGTITIRFTVAEDGRVQTAQVISPCPFPLLNQAAVRTVRESWRFHPGTARSFEVSIQFQLRQH